jgi:ABC-2 type transport system ATP-binding protein
MTALHITSVSKRYGDRVALDSMTFTVSPGEIFGFVGGNGAGKSTTMRIAMGLLAADAGAVHWGEAPVSPAVASGFGYMPEERGLYPKMTVARHLGYLARLHGHSREAAVAAMTRWTERLDIGRYRDRTIDSLSLGNQQRVQLAAALVHDPALLILDEPFSGLDPLAVDDMSEVLNEKAAEGVPVLFSSHQLDLVERLCDRVGVVREGRLVACGSIDELCSPEGEFYYLAVADAPPGWAHGIAPVASVRPSGDGVLIGLAPGADEQDLLGAAMAVGRVTEFRRQRLSLVDLFRTLVTGEPAQEKEEERV